MDKGPTTGVRLVIEGQLPRKSNSRRLVRNRGTGKTMFIKSKEALQYEKDFVTQVPADSRIGLDGLLDLSAIIYYRSNRSDLSDELLCDMLEKSGVISNDRRIVFKTQAKIIDKERPRVELFINKISKEDFDMIVGTLRRYMSGSADPVGPMSHE